MAYEPSVYEFTYLSSPAKTWKSFGTLTVEIKTPYFVIGDSEWTKTDGGYTRVYETLPDDELEFALSASENPVFEDNYNDGGLFRAFFFGLAYVWTMYLLIVLAPVALVVVIIVVNYKKSRKRKCALAKNCGDAADKGVGGGKNAEGDDSNGSDDKPTGSDSAVTAPTGNSQSGDKTDATADDKSSDLFED